MLRTYYSQSCGLRCRGAVPPRHYPHVYRWQGRRDGAHLSSLPSSSRPYGGLSGRSRQIPSTGIHELAALRFPISVGGEGYAVEVIGALLFVCIFPDIIVYADEVAKCRHYIIESTLMVGNTSGLNLPGPTRDKGHTYAAFVTLALESAQLSVAPEEFRIRTTLLMGAVIAGEYYQVLSSSPFSLSFASTSPT